MSKFDHHDLRLLDPRFSSPLLDVLTDLEYLRRHQMGGDTPLPVFLQLKRVFHLLESLASARIEGNRTTLFDLVEDESETAPPPAADRKDQMREIRNIDRAMTEIEGTVQPGSQISEHLLRSLHEMTVRELQREGDPTPGAYRSGAVRIAQAEHLPPSHVSVPQYMAELVEFINRADEPKYDLMKVALAHHRFAWIHPFTNGNGRVVRLLTYAMLLKYGFQVSMAEGEAGRLLNPAAVFCADRERYYNMLGDADRGTDEGLEGWCTYVLTGVRDEMQKVQQLTSHEYLQNAILLPAISFARNRELVTRLEADMLTATVKAQIIKAAGLAKFMPNATANQRTYQISKLVNAGMLVPIAANARQYTIGFLRNKLLRGVVQALTHEGFVSEAMSAPTGALGAPSEPQAVKHTA